MLAEIAHLSQALIAALTEAVALGFRRVRSRTWNCAEVVQHARELGDMLREAVQRAGDTVDDPTREMAATLAAAVESLEKQVKESGSMH